MDCVAVALQATEEAERDNADSQADQGNDDPNARDHRQQQFVHFAFDLWNRADRQTERQTEEMNTWD